MKARKIGIVATLAWLTALTAIAQTPLGSEFTYQGRLLQNGQPVPPGNVNLVFRLYNAPSGGTLLGTDNVGAWPVQEGGLVTVPIDFGVAPFATGEARWISITVNGNLLSPRQPLTPTPFALYALNAPGVGLWAASGTYIYNLNSGNVMVGSTTIAPLARLHVLAQDLGLQTSALENDDLIVEAQDAVIGLYSTNQGTWGSALALKEVDAGAIVDTWGIVRRTSNVSNPSALTFTYGPSNNYANNPSVMTLTQAGLIGIGTTTPLSRLDVRGPSGESNVEFRLIPGTNDGVSQIRLSESVGGSQATILRHNGVGSENRFEIWTSDNGTELGPHFVVRRSTGHIGIGTVSPATALHVVGTTRTSVLEITGGSDLSEGFAINGEAIEPGMVVAIDAANPGQLVLAAGAYDRKVAGVISGAGGVNPGMVMGQEGSIADGRHPVALTGRVYVWVDASYGAVEPGDLLTTSDTRGHAMKVADHGRAAGAVIGKAMTSLKDGRGLVLVLVSLQ
ncbi:MAG: hypothetical protein LC135_07895 [Phycisphaerae bacterium]|nr:hypothetical protein [Phycisphaerae bacterium]MCZ2399775.1 hypothetical protein [Phycisphaerae bacterium]